MNLAKWRIISLIAAICLVISSKTLSMATTLSDPELDLLARVVMSEASILPYEAKVAVAQTVLNRMERDGTDIYTVVYAPNQYSTANNGEPTEECYQAAKNALESMPFPRDMLYFRTEYYHSFGYPYMHIGNTYFSTLTDYNNLEEDDDDGFFTDMYCGDHNRIGVLSRSLCG